MRLLGAVSNRRVSSSACLVKAMDERKDIVSESAETSSYKTKDMSRRSAMKSVAFAVLLAGLKPSTVFGADVSNTTTGSDQVTCYYPVDLFSS